jgi:drug/metabolite transporter (DMT)-like permease
MVGPYSGGARLGDAFAALGTITQAMMIVAARWRPKVAMLPMIWIAVMLSVFLSIPVSTHCWDLTARDYLVAAGFGLGPMTFGMMLYVVGSAMIPAALAALIGVAEAPLGAAWAWIGVGEAPSTSTLVGGAIVLVSVALRILVERTRRTAD